MSNTGQSSLLSDSLDRRHFTLAEANAEVLAVRRAFDIIMQLRIEAKQLHARLDASGYPAHIDDDGQVHLSSEDGVDLDEEPPPATVLSWAGMLRATYAALHEQVSLIQESGAVIRDLEHGAVDWLAVHNGQEIWLSWRYGELEIDGWLEVQGGGQPRRPLSELAAPSE